MTSEKKYVLIKVPASSGGGSTFERLGEGISSLTVSNNGQVDTKQYINQKFSTSKRTGLQKQLAFSGDYVENNTVINYLLGLSEKVGSEVETEIVVFTLGAGETSPASTAYTAKKYNAIVDVSNDGSMEGGSDLSIEGTIYINGDPTTCSVTVTSNGTFTVD